MQRILGGTTCPERTCFLYRNLKGCKQIANGCTNNVKRGLKEKKAKQTTRKAGKDK